VRRAHARDAAGDDLAPLRDERMQQLDVLVVDVVNFFDAETANLLAPEVLFLSGDNSLVTAGGRCAALPGLPLDSAMDYPSFGKPGIAGAGPSAI